MIYLWILLWASSKFLCLAIFILPLAIQHKMSFYRILQLQVSD